MLYRKHRFWILENTSKVTFTLEENNLKAQDGITITSLLDNFYGPAQEFNMK